MKKLFAILLVIIMLNSLLIQLQAESLDNNLIVESSVTINGHYLYSDTNHLLVDDTVYVVGRFLVEALGGTIEWNAESQLVSIVFDEKKGIDIMVGSIEATVNNEMVQMHKPSFIVDGRTMIPLRFVSEQFGAEVSWDQSTYTVSIVDEEVLVPSEYIYDRWYTDEDLYLLSKIVTVESGDVSLEMAMAIANTVLNRVKDSRFPNTVSEVIYQVDRHVQFPPAHKASFASKEPSYLSTIAAKKALEGVNNIGYSLYFNNQPFKSKPDDLIRVIDGGEYFYY